MAENTTFLQEDQPVGDAANLSSQFSRLRMHTLFLASKNKDVKPNINHPDLRSPSRIIGLDHDKMGDFRKEWEVRPRTSAVLRK